MSKILAICFNTFREALRNKVLYSVVAFALVIVAISAFFGAVSIGDQVKVIKNFGLFCLSFFGAIITILTGVTLLNKELKQKTVYNILSKPVERWQFITGKFLGLTLTVWVLVSLMGTALIIFCVPFEGRLDFLMFQALFYILLEIGVVAAVVLFFSSFAVTTTLTGLFSLGAYLGGRSIHYVSDFFLAEKELDPVLGFIIRTLDTILPDLSVFNVSDSIVYGYSVGIVQTASASAYCAGYVLCVLALSVFIFDRKEML